ncbi:MAG: hypothetical protein ACRD0Y_08200 [Terriglobales bacterium]
MSASTRGNGRTRSAREGAGHPKASGVEPPAQPGSAGMRQFCHDISQPLMAARCSLELVQQLSVDDPARPGFLDDAIAALDRMSAAIELARSEISE